MESLHAGHLLILQVNFFFAEPFKGHLRSSEVTNSFLPIICDLKGMRHVIGVITLLPSSRVELRAI